MSILHPIKLLTPPLLWRLGGWAAKSALPSAFGPKGFAAYGNEQPAAFYDHSFQAADHWRLHYTASRYYPVWAIVADRVRKRGCQSILDIGCGPGQVACLMRDKGIPGYLGLDFSVARIQQAREVCPPPYRFEVADVFATDIVEKHGYDCVLIMEFLEHVERDVDILQRLKRGIPILATVPNFPSAGHVRYFETVDQVRRRYASYVRDITVDEHQENAGGKKYFLIEGTI